MYVHQVSSFTVVQCVSLIFLKTLSYLIIISATMSDIIIMKSSVFKQFWYGEFNGAIVFDDYQCMFMYFHLFSVVQWFSLILLKRLSYLIIICAAMSDIRIMKECVFKQFWYGDFNGAICFLVSINLCSTTFKFSVLISEFPWFSIKLKLLDNSFCQHDWH